MTDGTIESVMGRASQEEIRLVRFLYADHGGIIRGKAAGTTRLRERMASGIGHTVAMMAMSMLDQLQPVTGMGPVGEVRIVPDPETFVTLSYAPGAAAMLADLVKLYALIGRIRLVSPRPVVTAAERTLDMIIQAYLGPNRTLHEVLDDVHRGGFHFFTEFGEACRQDLGRD